VDRMIMNEELKDMEGNCGGLLYNIIPTFGGLK
jgi:hypothetical protein